MTERTRLPLSAAQRAIWLAHQLDHTRHKYTCAEYIRINGPVDVDALGAAWRTVHREADAVRIGSVHDGGADGLYQLVDPPGDPALTLVDVSGGADPERAADSWMRNDVRAPADLATGPISTSALLRLADDRFVFYFRSHHSVIDGYGVHLLGTRLAELYSAHVAGGTAAGDGFGPLDALLRQEADYRSSVEFAEDRDHWLGRFADRPPAMRLPASIARVADDDQRLRVVRPIDRADIDALAAAAAASHSTWQVVLLAAVAAYLHRVTGREDVLVGLPVTGRRTAIARRVPSMVTNTVPLRLAVTGDSTLTTLIPQVADEVRDALRHDRYRLEDIGQELGYPAEGAFLGPMVNFMPYERTLRFGSLPATTHNLSSGPPVDMAVAVRGHTGTEMSLVLEANENRHDRAALIAHRDALTAFVRALVARPDAPIRSSALVSEEDEHELLVARNATGCDVPLPTVPELFEAQARRTPNRIALSGLAGSWTYAALHDRVSEIAGHLAEVGVGQEDFVALALPRSPDLVAAMLAVLKTGAAYVPIDPAHPAERIRRVLADLAPAQVLTTAVVAAKVPAGHLLVEELKGGDTRVDRAIDPATAAYVVFTSGSTGAPKGVVVPHEALRNFVHDYLDRFGVDGHSRVLQFVSPSFDVAAGDVFPVLATGGVLVLAPDGQTIAPDALLDLLRDEHVTHASLPPALLAQLPVTPLPTLTTVLTGGEVPDIEALRRWSADRRLFNVYGVTEATVATTVSTPLTGAEIPPPIGTPIGGCQVYVLDATGAPVPPGLPGELYLAGAGLARGYAGRPDLTADRFVPCLHGPPGARMYRTGDLVRWRPDGQIEHLRRVDDQVKIRGFRIEPAEVEVALARHPEVGTAVAVVRQDEQRRQLVAYVQPLPGGAADPAELRRFVTGSLPDHMVPSAVVVLTTLPRTPNGKVDRALLPAPALSSSTVDESGAGPEEALLCDLFAQVLGLDRVGPHESFFDRGGDSIMVVRLVSRAREAGLRLSPADVFERRTVRELAAVVREAAAAVDLTARPATGLTEEQLAALARDCPGMSGVLPVSPLQEGFLYHNIESGRTGDAYVSQIRFDLTGPYDEARMRGAAEALVRRHPNLRTAFRYDDLPEAVQVEYDQVPLRWRQAHAESTVDAERLAADDRARGFDLTDPPLLRFLSIRLGTDRHRLVLTAHHILWDGWSTSILVNELFTLYSGAGAALPPVTPYPSYLTWLAAQDRVAARRAWAAALADLDGPTTVARGGNQAAARHEQLEHELSAELTATLVDRGLEHGITLNTIVQGAWAELLSQVTGRDDVTFGSSVSGRPPELPGIENMVGLLTNTVPVRVRRPPGESRMATLTRLQAEQAALIPHHHLGLAEIQRQAGGELFDTAIMFVNYDFDESRWDGALTDLRLTGFDVTDETHYPLRLAAVPGPRLRLRLGHHPVLIRPALARRLLDRLVAVIAAFADETHRTG
jgi:amino acid adenylation domain-containing protein